MIPTKLDIPDQENVLIRCVKSIRRLYPQEPIIIAVAKNSLPLTVLFDEYTQVTANPYFSVFGCLYLFYAHKYADQAWLLHDSVVLTREIPNVSKFSFLYHFYEPSLDRPRNDEGYRRLLNFFEYSQMLSTTKNGCFGNMFIIDHNCIEELDILRFIPKINTKYDFECMERILYFLAIKNKYPTTSLCGDIFRPIVNPWETPEYANYTLDTVLQMNFPAIFFKSIIARK
jgi:hypothetical protein